MWPDIDDIHSAEKSVTDQNLLIANNQCMYYDQTCVHCIATSDTYQILQVIDNNWYMYYESRFGKCKKDIRKTWKLINDILSKAKRQPSQKRFKEGENIIYDKAEIAHKFNKFFLLILGQILQIRSIVTLISHIHFI